MVSSSQLLSQFNTNNPLLTANTIEERPKPLDRKSNDLYQKLLRMAKRLNVEKKFRENDISFNPILENSSKVDSKSISSLDNEKIFLLQLLEYELSFEEIIYFRSLAERNISFETKKEGWLRNAFSWVSGSGSSSSSGSTSSSGKVSSKSGNSFARFALWCLF
jgi:hypothetical protein